MKRKLTLVFATALAAVLVFGGMPSCSTEDSQEKPCTGADNNNDDNNNNYYDDNQQ